MGTSSPMVPILSTEILPIPAFTKSYGEVPLKSFFDAKLGPFDKNKKDIFV